MFKKIDFMNMNIVFFSCLLISLLGCNTDETQTVTTLNNIIFEDNFDTDGSIDESAWNFSIGNGCEFIAGCGWGNNELQYYSDRPENVNVENGMLHITARKESFEGTSYTSARINTKGKIEQKYGRFEARMKLPWGQGMWPAFWMLAANIEEEAADNDPSTLAWPFCGEIDIMENRGQEPTLFGGSLHGPGYSAGEPLTKSYNFENDRLDTDFHVFGIEWGPNYFNFYVDDILYNRITPDDIPGTPKPDWVSTAYPGAEYDGLWNSWVFNDQPFYIIINLAVGGNYVGAPNENTVFPQTMLIDWVRIYEGAE